MAMKKKILVLDDDKSFLGSLKKALGNLFEIVPVTTPGEAVKALKGKEPTELIVMDYVVSGDQTAFDVQQKLDKSGMDVPLVIATAKGNEALTASAFKRGFIDYIPKKHWKEWFEMRFKVY